jgi:hypothetical protein
VFALQHFLLESTVEAFEVAGPFGDPALQFVAGLAFEGDPLQVMAPAVWVSQALASRFNGLGSRVG